jgi:hypothetical protein
VKALSIQQPWAWAILHLGKTIENRTWGTNYRGLIVVHAPKTVDWDAVAHLRECCGYDIPDPLVTDALVGTVRVAGCFPARPERAVDGQYHWWLEDPLPLPVPIPWALEFFEVPDEVLAR